MPGWKKNNFARETHGIAENTSCNSATSEQICSDPGLRCCRENIYQLGKRFVVGSTEIQSCSANTLLQSHGITEGNREQRNRNINSNDADVRV